MADSLLALLVILSMTSTLYAGEHRSVSLRVKIDSNLNAEKTKAVKRYTINFNAEALEQFRSCLTKYDSLSCCTRLTRNKTREYKADSEAKHCADAQANNSSNIFECFVGLDKDLNASSIKCVKVDKQKARDGKESLTLWLSFLKTNGGVPCVDVMWVGIINIQPNASVQETEVKLQRGTCETVSTVPTSSTKKTAKPPPPTTKTTKTTTTTATMTPSSTTLIPTLKATSHKNIKNDSENKDNKSLFLIIGVAAAVVVVIIIIIIISVVIWRRKKHQKIPITCNTASAYEYIDTTELVSQRDRNIDNDRGNPAVSSSTPLKNINNKRNKMEENKFNSMVDKYVSPEEIFCNNRAATAACGGDDDVTSDQGTKFIYIKVKGPDTVSSLAHVFSNTQDSHYETHDNVETSAQDSTSSATNIYSRLGEQVRNFQNPYSDLNNFKLNATTESCPADVNPSEPSTTTSTENVGPTIHTEPARQPFISTAYEYVDISQPLKNRGEASS